MDRAWVQVTPSEFSWERDALAFLKERLPDHEPYRAWANFEFLLDGSIGEVDVLVVSPKGVFLVEIKSWPGVVRGDAVELKELLDEGPGYQDFAAVHPRSEHAHRRVRIYGTPDADPLQREQITRAAQREFELLAPVQHPGIVHAMDLHEHELGPALVFERDPTEIRLDHYLDQRGSSLSLFDRLALVRDLAETVASAHGRRLTHRALSPRSVLVVRPGTPQQRFCIINWQTGARGGGSSFPGTVQGTRHVDQLIDTDTAPYLAPRRSRSPTPILSSWTSSRSARSPTTSSPANHRRPRSRR